MGYLNKKPYKSRSDPTLTYNLFDAFPDLIFVLSKDGVYLDYKGNEEELYVSPEVFMGKNIREIMPAKYAEVQINAIKNALDTHQVQIFEFNLPIRGESRHYEARFSPLSDDRVVAYIRNITKRKNIELKLKESEDKFKNIFMDSPIAIELYDAEGELQVVNKACLELFGVVDMEEIQGFKLFEDPNIPEKELEKLKKGETIRYEGSFDFEKVKEFNLYNTTKTGLIYLDVVISPLYLNEIKDIKNYLVQIQDNTEKKKAEHELRKLNEELEERVRKRTKELQESEERYKTLSNETEMILDHIPALVFYKDANNRFIRVNKSVADAYGVTKEDLRGKSLFELNPKDVTQKYWDDDLEVIKMGTSKLHFEEPWDTSEGRRWVLTSKIPNYDEEGKIKGIIGFSTDITKRKKAEQKLIKSEEKYRFAYEQANFYKDLLTHDISNIFQNIHSSLELYSLPQQENTLSERREMLLNIITEQEMRGKKLLSKVRKLSQLEEGKFALEKTEPTMILK